MIPKTFLLIFFVSYVKCECQKSLTTVFGYKAPDKGSICSGQLIFEDNFDFVDTSKWKFENTLAGGGNWEFQWYPGKDDRNVFTRDGNIHFVPTLTSDIFGEDFLKNGHVVIPSNECTQSDWYGCDRQGSNDHIINPIRSTKVDSRNSFAFKFGVVEIRAKLPAGDWLWPALWLMPRDSVYGGWPRSGEIDLMEGRGNRNLFNGNTNVGTEQIGSTLHFGPQWDVNGFMTAHYEKNSNPGFNEGFHNYKLEWTENYIKFYVDNNLVGDVDNHGGTFWDRGHFSNSGFENPWASGSKMAPFDQPFYIIMNLATGGTNQYFNDNSENRPYPKPWKNDSPRAAADFWQQKDSWLPTWNYGKNEDSHMQIDYVRVWAL